MPDVVNHQPKAQRQRMTGRPLANGAWETGNSLNQVAILMEIMEAVYKVEITSETSCRAYQSITAASLNGSCEAVDMLRPRGRQMSMTV